MRVLFAVAVTCVLSFALTARAAEPLARAKPEEVGMSSDHLSLIGKAVNEEIARGQLPGAVVAIARRGKLVYFEAFGYSDKDAGIRMTTDSIFSIASMTKPVVAVAALQLYEQGKLLMSDPLEKYLPKFANRQVALLDAKKESIVEKVPAARQITIQDLLRHTSGLSYGGGGSVVHKMYPTAAEVRGTSSATEFLDRLSSLPLPFQPGTVWEYGLGLDVVGLIIESLTDQTLGKYFESQIFKPLGMTDTQFTIPAEKMVRYAKALPNDPETGQVQPPRNLNLKFECGTGCLTSTAGDYLRFAHMLMNKGKYGETRILGRKTVEYMLSNQLGPEVTNQIGSTSPIHSDYGFGLGLAVRTAPGIVRMTGSVGTFTWPGATGTYWWVDPAEELAVVWMAHTPSLIVRRHWQMMHALVNRAIVD
jgi:CubicO group peptidase (beta-lactamase class C family)